MATDYRRRWATEDAAVSHLENVRWGDHPTCPYCSSDRLSAHASKDKNVPRRQCQECHRAFSPTVGTPFHGSHVSIRNWLLANAALHEDGGKLSIANLGRTLDLPYKTTWSMVARLRTAMRNDPDAAAFLKRLVEAPARKPDASTPIIWGGLDKLLARRGSAVGR